LRVVGFLNESDQTRGIQRVTRELCGLTGVSLFTYKRPLRRAPRTVRKVLLLTVGYNLLIPRRLAEVDADVYHAFSPLEAYPLTLAKKKPIVVTSYDLFNWVPLSTGRRDFVFREYSRFLKHYDSIAYHNAERIVCISETHKNELARLGLDSRKLRVIYPGISDRFRPLREKSLSKSSLGVNGRLVMMLPDSATDSSGVPVTLNAISAMKRNGQYADLQIRLVGVRQSTGDYGAIVKMIRRLGLQECVTILPYVSDDELVLNYNAADVFVHCDLSDEFNLPPLEAMACATPVINLGEEAHKMFSIYGNESSFVRYDDAESLRTEVERIFSDKNYAEALVSHGLSKVKEFSWKVAAAKTIELYEEVAR
jgi:glycosyltransferase involved in cell wall biosynthesis